MKKIYIDIKPKKKKNKKTIIEPEIDEEVFQPRWEDPNKGKTIGGFTVLFILLFLFTFIFWLLSIYLDLSYKLQCLIVTLSVYTIMYLLSAIGYGKYGNQYCLVGLFCAVGGEIFALIVFIFIFCGRIPLALF